MWWTVVMFDGKKWWHTGEDYNDKRKAMAVKREKVRKYQIVMVIPAGDLCEFC